MVYPKLKYKMPPVHKNQYPNFPSVYSPRHDLRYRNMGIVTLEIQLVQTVKNPNHMYHCITYNSRKFNFILPVLLLSRNSSENKPKICSLKTQPLFTTTFTISVVKIQNLIKHKPKRKYVHSIRQITKSNSP